MYIPDWFPEGTVTIGWGAWWEQILWIRPIFFTIPDKFVFKVAERHQNRQNFFYFKRAEEAWWYVLVPLSCSWANQFFNFCVILQTRARRFCEEMAMVCGPLIFPNLDFVPLANDPSSTQLNNILSNTDASPQITQIIVRICFQKSSPWVISTTQDLFK